MYRERHRDRERQRGGSLIMGVVVGIGVDVCTTYV